MKRKLFAILSAICMMISVFPIYELAASAANNILRPDETWVMVSRQYPVGDNQHLRVVPSGGINVIGYAKKGDCFTVPSVDFGTDGYKSISMTLSSDPASSSGTIDVTVGGVYGDIVAEIPITKTTGFSDYQVFTADFNVKITGAHDLTFRFKNSQGNVKQIELSGTPDAALSAMGVEATRRIVKYPGSDSTQWVTTPGSANPNFGLSNCGANYRINGDSAQLLGYSGPGCNVVLKNVDFGTEGIGSVTLAVGSAEGAGGTFQVTVEDSATTLATATVPYTPSGDWNSPYLFSGNFNNVVTGTHDVRVTWVNGGNLFTVVLVGKDLPPSPPSGGNSTDPYEQDGKLIVPASSNWTLTPGTESGSQLQYVSAAGCIGYNKQKNIITSPALQFTGKVYSSISMDYAYPAEDGADGKVDVLLGGVYGAYLCTLNIPATGGYSTRSVASIDLPVAIPEGSQLSFRFYGTAGTIANVYNVSFSGDGSALPAASSDMVNRDTFTPDSTWNVHDSGNASQAPSIAQTHQYYKIGPYYGYMSDGDIITIPNVDFGSNGFSGIELYMANDTSSSKADGTVEVTVDNKLIGTVNIQGTADWWVFKADSADFSYKVTGKHDVELKYVKCHSNIAAVVFKGVASADLPDYSLAGGGTAPEVVKVKVETVSITFTNGSQVMPNINFTLNGLISKDGSTGEMDKSETGILDKTYTTDQKGKAEIQIIRGQSYVLTFNADLSSYGLDSDLVYEIDFSDNDTADSFLYDVSKSEFVSDKSGLTDDNSNPDTGDNIPLVSVIVLALSAVGMLFIGKKIVVK